VAAVAVLLAAMLHNGWFTDMNRRLSELAKNVSAAKEKSDDEPSGNDEVADENDVDDVVADPELVEDGEDAALDEGGRHSAPILDQRKEKGDT
jgi:hypothetical protein